MQNLAMRAADAAKNTVNLIEATVKKVKDGSQLVTRAIKPSPRWPGVRPRSESWWQRSRLHPTSRPRGLIR